MEKPIIIYKKECVRCREIFRPSTRNTKVCDNCVEIGKAVRNLRGIQDSMEKMISNGLKKYKSSLWYKHLLISKGSLDTSIQKITKLNNREVKE